MLKRLIPLFFFILSATFFAQTDISSKSYTSNKLEQYKSEINLNKEQFKNFKKIFKNYNKELQSILEKNSILKDSDKRLFNNSVKNNDYKLRQVMTPKQFETYLIVRKKIEPFKNYKI